MDFAKGVTVQDGVSLSGPYGDTAEVLIEVA
jgi:hypothetical protein